MFVRNILHTGVTRSMTYVDMTLGNQCSSDDDVINTSLRSAGSAAHGSPHDRIEMKATEGEWREGKEGERVKAGREPTHLQRTVARQVGGVRWQGWV